MQRNQTKGAQGPTRVRRKSFVNRPFYVLPEDVNMQFQMQVGDFAFAVCETICTHCISLMITRWICTLHCIVHKLEILYLKCSKLNGEAQHHKNV